MNNSRYDFKILYNKNNMNYFKLNGKQAQK